MINNKACVISKWNIEYRVKVTSYINTEKDCYKPTCPYISVTVKAMHMLGTYVSGGMSSTRECSLDCDNEGFQ